jgi:hypothetical protein
MTGTLDKATEAIAQAEKSLRTLMQASIEAGKYEDVTVLARWAEQLASIANGRHSLLPTGLGVEPVADGRQHQVKSRACSPKTSRRERSKKSKRTYPVFERTGDQIVKIGWSKVNRDEYEHRSPKGVALALLQKMQRLSGDRELITMDDVLPLRLAGDETEVPPYQSYMCLAWLRSIAVVRQHGRQGYSLIETDKASAAIDRAWELLPRYGRKRLS